MISRLAHKCFTCTVGIYQRIHSPTIRKLYTNNGNYRNKVGNLVGVTEFLVAVGFIERPGNNMFEWSTDDDKDVDNTRSKLDFFGRTGDDE